MRTAALMLATAALAAASPARADECLQQAFGSPLNCTANDIQATSVEITDLQNGCSGAPGDTFTFSGILHVTSNATNRYDVGFYFGNNPLTDTNSDCTVTPIPPDPSLGPQDGDTCGDVSSAMEVSVPIQNLTAPCTDADQNGFIDISTCSVWKNSASSTDCPPLLPETKSKCDCQIVNSNLPIPQPECLADSDCVSTGPCEVGVCTSGNCLFSFEPTTTVCRPSAGICDTPETCTGSSADCPADTLSSSTTTCRAAAGVCDVAEACTGTSPSCPGDTFASGGITCRESAGVCDVAESCTGTSASCPDDTFQSSTTTCRASAGVCDVAETCTGNSASCPGDTFQSSTTTCRDATGICDSPENCTGNSAQCPPDAFVASAAVCRASTGVCDVAELCTGAGGTCPPDQFAPSTTVCRGSAGVCDVAETCTGNGPTCPADSFQPSTTVCRASAGECDQAENCTGGSASCPGNEFLPDGTTCSTDNNVCTNDICASGSCTHVNNTAPCNDNQFCTVNDTCSNGSCNGTARDCGLASSCATVTCSNTLAECEITANDSACDDNNDCTQDTCSPTAGCEHSNACPTAICRSPGFWSTHAGTESKGHRTGVNITQELIDAVGPLQVCGETISTTSGATLSDALEALCVTVQGVQDRQLFRQLVAAALNCAVTGDASNCDSVVPEFSACSDLCAGTVDPNAPTVNDCIGLLDCFNNGGQIESGQCATGTCQNQPSVFCGGDFGDCPLLNGLTQACITFPGNCESAALCNHDINFCPASSPASSTDACKQARFDQCTIDSCP